jgi:hypothetical protein
MGLKKSESDNFPITFILFLFINSLKKIVLIYLLLTDYFVHVKLTVFLGLTSGLIGVPSKGMTLTDGRRPSI